MDALRYFLSGFRIVGEAAIVDRTMEKFAERYCRDNPTVFKHQDTAYTLAFSLMMLNTDQHSKDVKNRMSVEAFVRNNRYDAACAAYASASSSCSVFFSFFFWLLSLSGCRLAFRLYIAFLKTSQKANSEVTPLLSQQGAEPVGSADG